LTAEVAQRIKEAGARAEVLRKRGFSCSEAVLRGAASALGVALDPALHRASTGLRGGGGGYGDRCGALEGGALLIGLIYGREEPDEDNTCASQLVRWLHEKFAHELGSTACRVLKPLSYTEWSDDFSCGPIYRRGAELAAEAVLTAPALCITCAPYDPAHGQVERVPVDAAALHAVLSRIHVLAESNRLVITQAAREAQDRLGVSEEEVASSLAAAKRVRPAWGGNYVVEGRKPDRYWLTTVVRFSPDVDSADRLEVAEIF
jgi:C_GCAxxG_C_C family probable redox protein